jgi:L-asparaginase
LQVARGEMTTKNQTVVVLATGGTIAGTETSAATGAYRSATLGIDALLRGVQTDALLRGVHPQALLRGVEPTNAGAASALAPRVNIEAVQLAQIDSKDMTHAVWRALAQACVHHAARPEVQGIVITHGTDTMEETAYFLHRVLAATKPVVLTGAMRPATAQAPDGPNNLRQALRLAQLPDARGVVVLMAGEVHAADAVQKVHPTQLQAFASGECGGLARFVNDEVQAWQGAGDVLWPASPKPKSMSLPPADRWPKVVLWPSHAGMDAAVTAALMDAAVAAGVQGIVVAATGNGTVHHVLHDALLTAQARGVALGVATRCAWAGSTGEPWAPLADGLVGVALHPSPPKARIDLMLRLMGLMELRGL